ncbi:putative E3 ubiquitin-protein ligase LIN isoform X1 [Gastrolobium bilobum]|uniref:putative E3 ubiquitin-protein ligase LIN isoform X1 n=1 Tax=Gastrolobium bilobum TaxID=150636 RepID=UPI002AB0F0F2|nr:putative E3 ubiquitin-protein ligase LIN isoform X1 [Gastrolobium bilobum]
MVWKMIQKKMEYVEVIVLKEPIHHLRAHDETIFAITESQGIKLIKESRVIGDIIKGKEAKCMAVAQRKLYIGCTDSSIQIEDQGLSSSFFLSFVEEDVCSEICVLEPLLELSDTDQDI